MSSDLPEPALQPHRETAPLWWLPTIAIAVLVLVFSTFVVEFVFSAVRMAMSAGRPTPPPDQLSLVFRTAVSLILQITLLMMVVRLSGYRIGEYFKLRLPRI